MAIMDSVFDIFDTGIRFPNGDIVKGNNTYTYVASFPVSMTNFTTLQSYNPGIFTGIGSSIFFNAFGEDIYFALDTNGSEVAYTSPGSSNIVQVHTGNSINGHWPHLEYGVSYPSGRKKWSLYFKITGFANSGSGAPLPVGTITVRVYVKPSNSLEGLFETDPLFGGPGRPNGGNYPGSFYGV